MAAGCCLVEVEGRQGIAQLFDVPPLPYEELKIATADGGGHVNALAIDIEAAFLEYLDMFYNLGIAGRAMRRIGAIEFATTIAPGLRDVLLTGKIKESVVRLDRNKRPAYDAIVVDSPTGRIARFLDVTKAVSDLAKGGPVHSQAEGVVKLLHSDQTAIHLVTLLEALPIRRPSRPSRSSSPRPADRQRDRQPQHPAVPAAGGSGQGRRG